MMRLEVLTCETLFREIYQMASASPHICDIKLLPRDLHDDLDAMKRGLQAELDIAAGGKEQGARAGINCPACAGQDWDAVVLCMGLCGNTTNGLKAEGPPLVLPRVHDCAGLLLGNNSRYMHEERRTVFYHQGAVERLGAAQVDAVPRRFGLGRTLEEYIERYGEENGRYIHQMEMGFARYNDRALYLYNPATPKVAYRCERQVRDYVARFGWRTEPVPIELDLIRRLLFADWEGDDIIVIPPGGRVDLTVRQGGAIAERSCAEVCK